MAGMKRSMSFSRISLGKALVSTAPTHHPWLGELRSQFRQKGLTAFLIWSNVVASRHASALAFNVEHDRWDYANRKLDWERAQVRVEGESKGADLPDMASVGGKGDDTSAEELYLPFQPSAYVMDMLFSICREIDRIGPHVVERSVLQFMVREMGERVHSIYSTLIHEADINDHHHNNGGGNIINNNGSKHFCKEGVVQLLCDVCYLLDTFGPHRDTSSSSSSSTSSSQQSYKSSLQQQQDAPVAASEAEIKAAVTSLRNIIINSTSSPSSSSISTSSPSPPSSSLVPLSLFGNNGQGGGEDGTNKAPSWEDRFQVLVEWRRKSARLIAEAQAMLDPIELAFYEPHIKTFSEKCHTRSALLLGSLMHVVHKSQADARQRPPTSATGGDSHNIVPLAKAVSRFQHLPVSAPPPPAPLPITLPPRSPLIAAPVSSSSSSSMFSSMTSLFPLSSSSSLGSSLLSSSGSSLPTTSSSSSSSMSSSDYAGLARASITKPLALIGQTAKKLVPGGTGSGSPTPTAHSWFNLS
eukprot:TRINITY_DN7420_c0_g1_i3.p1 TRINITY_DN7420_c0_g1~~TRINITY_DN7420_c0_g1_i3.p1  ORF type:complete len:526 (+),score=134.81 TRINITY_DN7420_c0_g1_i3:169-1746(+)